MEMAPEMRKRLSSSAPYLSSDLLPRARERPQVSGSSSKATLAGPPPKTVPPSKAVSPIRPNAPVKSSGPASISVNNREGQAHKRPRHSQESTTKVYRAPTTTDQDKLFQNLSKASKDPETTGSMKSTNNDRRPTKRIILQSATESRRHPPIVIVLSDSDEEVKYPKDSKDSKLIEKIATPDHNGAEKSLPLTKVKKSTTVLKEGFSRKRTGWKRPKVDLEPATSCQWNQHVRKREEDQQEGLWKNVISQNCFAAFRNPRNLVDHYLNHMRKQQGTIECPVKDCRMLLRSSKSLKAHNNLFHQKAAGKQYTKPSPSSLSSSTLIAAKPSGSAVNGAPSVTAQLTQSGTLPSKRIAVSDLSLRSNQGKWKLAPQKMLKDNVFKIYTISDFSSSPSSKDLSRSNRNNNIDNNNIDNNVDNNDNDDESDKTVTDDDYMSLEDIVDGEAENSDQEAKNPSYVSESEVNPLPEVLGPFFTWLRKK